MGNKNYNNNENKSINNNESSSQYKLIFHYPIKNNDCINSIDIFDDKVAIGTLMGDAYLIRVDKNNLDVKGYNHNQFLNYNSDSDNNNFISKESSTFRNKKSLTVLMDFPGGRKMTLKGDLPTAVYCNGKQLKTEKGILSFDAPSGKCRILLRYGKSKRDRLQLILTPAGRELK